MIGALKRLFKSTIMGAKQKTPLKFEDPDVKPHISPSDARKVEEENLSAPPAQPQDPTTPPPGPTPPPPATDPAERPSKGWVSPDDTTPRPPIEEPLGGDSIRTLKEIETDPTAPKIEKLYFETKIPKSPDNKAININFDYIVKKELGKDDIEGPEDLQTILGRTAAAREDEINQARRGVVTWTETQKAANRELASDMGLSLEQLLKRRRGDALNDKGALKARMLLAASSEKMAHLMNKILSGEGSDIDKFNFRKQMAIQYAIQAQVSGMTAEAGRTLNIFKKPVGSTQIGMKQMDEFMRMLDQKSSTKEIAALMSKIDTAAGVNTFVRQLKKATTWDVVMEAWINGLLSGPQTHAVNTLSNALFAVWQVPERFLASTIGRITPGRQEIKETEALYQAFGLVQGFKDGLKMGVKTIITGEGSDLYTKYDLSYRTAFSSQNFGMNSGSYAARLVDLLGETIRLPGRLLTAGDEVFKGTGYRMELEARALRQATEEGLTGRDKALRINEIINDPPDDIKLAAIDAARYQTFTSELGGGGQSILKLVSQIPALRLIVPFIRTPTNILKRVGERTLLGLASKRIRADIAAGGARRDLAVARMSLGSMVMATVAMYTAEGKITGGGPSDPKMQQALRRTGWRPYSIKIGNKYYSYNRLEPLGMLLGIGADVGEILGQLGEEEGGDLALAAVIAFTKNVTSKTWIRGIAETVAVLDDPDRNAKRYLSNYARSLVPTGLAQLERYLDPLMESTKTGKGKWPGELKNLSPETKEALERQYSDKGFFFEIYNSIKSRVPGWSKTLPGRLNFWGELIILEGGLGWDLLSPIYSSTGQYSPIDDEIVRLKLGFNHHKMNIPLQGETVGLDPLEYNRYIKLINEVPVIGRQNLKDSLDNLVTEDVAYERASNDRKRMMIRGYVNLAREQARVELFNESPNLQFLVQQIQNDRLLQGVPQ